ncbi:MAG TPA: ABC transporter substrate-binding protein [Steroidobacteraceae bacterium]|nr:ABC transporter substrate-binding protein [Steroidobacteraceae bacterium]
MPLSRLCLVVLCLCCAAAAPAAAPPRRIVSLNFCTDQLLLALVPPERIASLTWLARTDGDAAQRALAARLPANRGSAEEVLALHPDLVLAGRYTTAITRALLKRTGAAMLEVDAAQDWEGIRRTTREVAAAVGATARGEVLLAHMDAALAAAAALRVADPVRVIGWNGAAADVPGADTLFDTILRTAGAVNIAARPGAAASFDLEQVVRARPRVLLRGTSYAGARTLRAGVADHPVLRALPDIAIIDYPEGAWACGVPAAADYALDLARRLRALPAVGRTP